MTRANTKTKSEVYKYSCFKNVVAPSRISFEISTIVCSIWVFLCYWDASLCTIEAFSSSLSERSLIFKILWTFKRPKSIESNEAIKTNHCWEFVDTRGWSVSKVWVLLDIIFEYKFKVELEEVAALAGNLPLFMVTDLPGSPLYLSFFPSYVSFLLSSLVLRFTVWIPSIFQWVNQVLWVWKSSKRTVAHLYPVPCRIH